MKLTRDGWIWTVGMVLGLTGYFATHFNLLTDAFPGLDPVWQERLELLSTVIGILSGKVGFSPLPASPDAPAKDRSSSGPNQP